MTHDQLPREKVEVMQQILAAAATALGVQGPTVLVLVDWGHDGVSVAMAIQAHVTDKVAQFERMLQLAPLAVSAWSEKTGAGTYEVLEFDDDDKGTRH